MKNTFISKAYVAINTAVEEKWLKPRVTRELSNIIVPLLKNHIESMRSEVNSTSWTMDHMSLKDAPSGLQTKALELRRLLSDAEGRINTMVFKNSPVVDFGTQLKEVWLKKVFNDARDVKFLCGFTDYKEFQSEQDKIVDAVRTESQGDGARKLMADAKVNIGKAATGTESQLLNLMRGVSNAQRYELFSKVDLYIRSGHAHNDLETDAKTGKKLRAALTELDKHPKNSTAYSQALQKAQSALYSRFDDVFLAVQIKKEKIKGSGDEKYVVVPPMEPIRKQKKPESELYACQQTAPSGYVDSAIMSVDGETLYAALATSNATTENLVKQGVQLTYHGSALKDYCEKHNMQLDLTAVMRASHTERKVTNEFLDMIGVLSNDKTTKKALDTLQVLTMLCAMPNGVDRSSTRFLMVGKNFDFDSREYVPANWGQSVVDVLKPVLAKLSHPDTQLVANSKPGDMINQVAGQLREVLASNTFEDVVINNLNEFHKAGDQLMAKVVAASTNFAIRTNDFKMLASELHSIRPTLSYSV